MHTSNLSTQEKAEIKEIYGKSLSELSPEEFEVIHKTLRQKYHPDKFEHFDDAVVREMAHEKFQRIESLGKKIRMYLQKQGSGKVENLEADWASDEATFAYQNMRIDIITREKDLKYHLFGTRLRWLEQGEVFRIPNTQASLIMDTDHMGVSVGFVETIRIYLSFGELDDLDIIIDWLHQRLAPYADALIIEGKRIKVDLNAMQSLIRRKSFLRLDGGK